MRRASERDSRSHRRTWPGCSDLRQKAWPSLEIVNLDRTVKEIERLVSQPTADQADDIARALARFLVVRTSGYLEQVVKECCSAFSVAHAVPQVAAFAVDNLKIANPTPDRLLNLVGAFDSAWRAELETRLDADDQLLRREIAFLVDRRNKIAHGVSESVTARKALDLLEAARDVADWFLLRFDPR